MKYPMLNNTVRFQKLPGVSGGYFAYDCLLSWNYILSRKYYDFVRHLDGRTDPYSIDPRLSREEVDEMLQELDDQQLLRYERTLFREFCTRYITLYTIGTPGRAVRGLAAVFNLLLLVLWFPALLLSLPQLGRTFLSLMEWPYFRLLAAAIPGTLLATLLHECGHIFAAFAYGAPVFEIGLLCRPLFPGMYVITDPESLPNPLRKAQIDAAGLETDCVFAAVCFLLSRLTRADGFWGISGFCAAISVFVNALPIPGLDGRGILANLIEAVTTRAEA